MLQNVNPSSHSPFLWALLSAHPPASLSDAVCSGVQEEALYWGGGNTNRRGCLLNPASGLRERERERERE